MVARRLLDQARRARDDAALNAVMDDLAESWGGMGLEDEGWANLISALETCLPDKGGGDARHASWPH